MPSIIETARWAAAQRARESERPDRLFFDPFAGMLAGTEGLAALRLSEQYNPRHEETANYISIRIRLFDDIAREGAKYNPQRFRNRSRQSMMSFFIVARRT